MSQVNGDMSLFNLVLAILSVTLLPWLLFRVYVRLQLSLAKHPSLRGHAKWSRRMARFVAPFDYDKAHFTQCDGAPDAVAATRQRSLAALEQRYATHFGKTLDYMRSLSQSVSDVQFTTRYRVPFPFRNCVGELLRYGSVADASAGVQVRDLDGHWSYDLFGSYGVNVFGYDFYKDCLDEAVAEARDLGPVLGPYHPVIRDNVERLKKISGLDEVSFHMSGTEAVMQAVRLARYHTGRSHLVRFCGAYHGWWDGVQPGVGNNRPVNDVYTLAEMSSRALTVLRTRKDIACVLINPLQGLNPNGDAPSDSTLIASDRTAHFDHQRYQAWLQSVRAICTERNIVLIMDEVFTGFRLAYRGAQAFYGVQGDLVTYGKTLGGGLPVGVLCGRHDLMMRFKAKQPANISFARGTFNSHPYVMTAMNAFLRRIEQPAIQQIYNEADAVWRQRAIRLNDALAAAGLPLQVAHLHSIFTLLYTQPGRFNWMLQFYLKVQGIELGWIGTGRFIFSLNYSDADFDAVIARVVAAGTAMQQDGWFAVIPGLSNKAIKRQFMLAMLSAKFPWLQGLLGGQRTAMPSGLVTQR